MLIVDTQTEAARYADDFRVHSGAPIVLAENREAALDALDQHDIGLMILDFSRDLAQSTAIYFDMLGIPVHHSTPALLLATRDTARHAQKMARRPIDRVVHRPVSGRVLAAEAREALKLPERRGVELMIRLYRADANDPFPIRAKTLNVSEGGLFVQSQRPLEIGSRMRVVMGIPGSEQPLELTAVVRRQETMGQDLGYGMQVEKVLSGDRLAFAAAYGVQFQ